jgi:hypothetical protein
MAPSPIWLGPTGSRPFHALPGPICQAISRPLWRGIADLLGTTANRVDAARPTFQRMQSGICVFRKLWQNLTTTDPPRRNS